MKRRQVLSLAVGSTLAAAARAGRAGEVVRIATLAPAQSPWGQVYRVWIDAVQKRSEGRLSVELFYNGQQGDEAAMVAKLKSGQLDGATLTSVGLARIILGKDQASVAALLDEGADIEIVYSLGFGTPLLYAALQGDRAMVELLLDRGADPRAFYDGDTAASLAEGRGHVELAERLRRAASG